MAIHETPRRDATETARRCVTETPQRDAIDTPRRYATPTGQPCPYTRRADGSVEGDGACRGCGTCLLGAGWEEPAGLRTS